MGMSASQVRLLGLTSRLHDVELKAQNIEAQKLALATQEDEIYDEFCAAQDATKLYVGTLTDTNGTEYDTVASFSSMCTYDPNRVATYSLVNQKTGFVYVSQEEYDAYNEYGTDKYAFAAAMLGEDYVDAEEFLSADSSSLDPDDMPDIIQSFMEAIQEDTSSTYDDIVELYESYEELYNNYSGEDEPEADDDVKDAYEKLMDKIYTKYASELLYVASGDGDFDDITSISDDKSDYNDWVQENSEVIDQFKYYCTRWEAIDEAGGCEVLDKQYQSGDDGEEWLQNSIQSGLVTMEMYNKTSKTWKTASISTDYKMKELQDDEAYSKAEAEYEHKLKLINRKDTKFDNELSKLETERTSITTEMDSIKTVVKDNIERTFKLFS